MTPPTDSTDAPHNVRLRNPNGRIHDEEQGPGFANEYSHPTDTESTRQSTREKPNDAHHIPGFPDKVGLRRFWHRFMRKGKKKVGVVESLKAIFFNTWLNILLVLIPIAWVAHFESRGHANEDAKWPPRAVFTLCFLSIIPLERLFDYGGEQMAYYCGKDLGDLIVVTLNNAVEATLAIILLLKCELKLLQSTIIGVIILHLLLIPGTSFITGGARVLEQNLHPHLTELNHSLLTIGVLTLLLPAAFFAALNTGFTPPGETAEVFITDKTRDTFLQMSRGLAVMLLLVYICSRIFLHNPPGEITNAPAALKEEEDQLELTDPEVNQFVCLAMIVICIGLMAATAEWLVESIEFVREEGNIQLEWFGLILLPIVSFAADGAVAIVFFVQSVFRHLFNQPSPPATLAKARAIDLSIQFTLFWMPFLVLLGWWTNKPMTLLFDLFEVSIIIGSCFIVNYVTADAKTNWAEGFAMVSFYLMIALCAWFYTGQAEVAYLLACPSVEEALLGGLTES